MGIFIVDKNGCRPEKFNRFAEKTKTPGETLGVFMLGEKYGGLGEITHRIHHGHGMLTESVYPCFSTV